MIRKPRGVRIWVSDMREIPLRPIPNQTLETVLGGQNCSLRLYTRLLNDTEHLYCDLAVNQSNVFAGVICQELVDLKLYRHWAFAGILAFIDLQGEEPPNWRGLNERWKLLYLEEGEEW